MATRFISRFPTKSFPVSSHRALCLPQEEHAASAAASLRGLVLLVVTVYTFEGRGVGWSARHEPLSESTPFTLGSLVWVSWAGGPGPFLGVVDRLASGDRGLSEVEGTFVEPSFSATMSGP